MKALLIFCAILIVLSQIRIGGRVEYRAEGLFVKVRVGPLKIQICPLRKKGKKEGKTPKNRMAGQPKSKGESGGQAAPGGELELVREFLPLAAEAAGNFKRKIRIDWIMIDLCWAATDPADVALGFGLANGVLGMLWPILEHNFTVKERQIQTRMDYSASRPTIWIGAALSLKLGQALTLGFRLGWKALLIVQRNKKEKKQKETV